MGIRNTPESGNTGWQLWPIWREPETGDRKGMLVGFQAL